MRPDRRAVPPGFERMMNDFRAGIAQNLFHENAIAAPLGRRGCATRELSRRDLTTACQ